MLSKVFSAATVGLEARVIEVEVDIPNEGLPRFNIVGLPDKAVEESKERVRSAMKNTGAKFPEGRITVNLAPADLPKVGPSYDLPIALGMLIASGQIAPDISDAMFIGELSLDGALRHTNGILSITNFAKGKKIRKIFLPKVNADEAALVGGIVVYPIESLLELTRYFHQFIEVKPMKTIPIEKMLITATSDFDFSEIIGQESAKRAMTIAAAGGHNIFLRGTPGSGKTMISRALPGILPRLSEEEALEVTKIYSITGNLAKNKSLITSRPFRSPHHTTSRIGLIGGGSNPMPGEVSLAHRGVLFLDEFPEFPRSVLESLRQPMEDGVVTISRARASATYPARFLLVAASNPCPCGYFGDTEKPCKCLPGQISRYQKRISGPLLDRIDIHVNVPSVDTNKLVGTGIRKGETSKRIQRKVQKARDIQRTRLKSTGLRSNSEMNTKDIKRYCKLSQDCLAILRSAVSQLSLSARSYFKVVKVARTIADLEGTMDITKEYIAEALQYRPKDDAHL